MDSQTELNKKRLPFAEPLLCRTQFDELQPKLSAPVVVTLHQSGRSGRTFNPETETPVVQSLTLVLFLSKRYSLATSPWPTRGKLYV